MSPSERSTYKDRYLTARGDVWYQVAAPKLLLSLIFTAG